MVESHGALVGEQSPRGRTLAVDFLPAPAPAPPGVHFLDSQYRIFVVLCASRPEQVPHGAEDPCSEPRGEHHDEGDPQRAAACEGVQTRTSASVRASTGEREVLAGAYDRAVAGCVRVAPAPV